MKRFFKILGLILLALILLKILFLTALLGWVKWTGDREWKRVQAELRAKREPLTFAELVPPPPPDSENFFTDPMWLQLSALVPHANKGRIEWIPSFSKKDQIINQWDTPLANSELGRIQLFLPNEHLSKTLSRKDAIKRLAVLLNKSTGDERLRDARKQIAQLILDLEAPANSLLSRTQELLKRPSAYFPLRYQDNFYTSLPHCMPLLTLGQLLSAKALSELTLGQKEAASKDIQTLFNLSKVVNGQPNLICALVGKTIIKLATDPLATGIAEHEWNDVELKRFQDSLLSIDLIALLPRPLRGERAGMSEASLIDISALIDDDIRTGSIVKIGQYFFQEQEKAVYAKGIQQLLDTLAQYPNGGINNSSIPPTLTADGQAKDFPGQFHYLSSILVLLSQSGTRTAIEGFIETQTQVGQSLIACALERYYLAHASYPASLDALVPEYLSALPKQPTTGEAMQYQLLNPNKFLLWATGWNLHSLGGKPGAYRGDGDIVWNQPLRTGDKPLSSAAQKP